MGWDDKESADESFFPPNSPWMAFCVGVKGRVKICMSLALVGLDLDNDSHLILYMSGEIVELQYWFDMELAHAGARATYTHSEPKCGDTCNGRPGVLVFTDEATHTSMDTHTHANTH